MNEPEAQTDDVRQVAMMMHMFSQSWAGKLGAGPQTDSPLARDRAEEQNYATTRLAIPMSQAWTFAQTLGQAATNDEEILREALQRNANGEGARPVTAVDTLTRGIVELLSLQTWLTDSALTSRERVARWLSLERKAVLAQWKMTQPGKEHDSNPAAQALMADAKSLGVEITGVPSATALVGRSLKRLFSMCRMPPQRRRRASLCTDCYQPACTAMWLI